MRLGYMFLVTSLQFPVPMSALAFPVCSSRALASLDGCTEGETQQQPDRPASI